MQCVKNCKKGRTNQIPHTPEGGKRQESRLDRRRHAFNTCWSPFPAGPGLAAGRSVAGWCIRPPQRDKRTKFEKWKAICQRTLLWVPTEQKWISAPLHLTSPPQIKSTELWHEMSTAWDLSLFLPTSLLPYHPFLFLYSLMLSFLFIFSLILYTVWHLWTIYHSFHLATQHLFLVSLQVSAISTFSSFSPSLCSTCSFCSFLYFLHSLYFLHRVSYSNITCLYSLSLVVSHVSCRSKANHLQTNSLSKRQLSDISVKRVMPAMLFKPRRSHARDENDLKTRYIYVQSCEAPNHELTNWFIMWTGSRLIYFSPHATLCFLSGPTHSQPSESNVTILAVSLEKKGLKFVLIVVVNSSGLNGNWC